MSAGVVGLSWRLHARGGEQVASAMLLLLSSLVAKSLLRRHTSGNYDLHELVRQYAAGQTGGLPAVKLTRRMKGRYIPHTRPACIVL